MEDRMTKLELKVAVIIWCLGLLGLLVIIITIFFMR